MNVLCDVFTLVIHIRPRTGCLPLDDGELHVLDLNADK